jgi:hypothetical protein
MVFPTTFPQQQLSTEGFTLLDGRQEGVWSVGFRKKRPVVSGVALVSLNDLLSQE